MNTFKLKSDKKNTYIFSDRKSELIYCQNKSGNDQQKTSINMRYLPWLILAVHVNKLLHYVSPILCSKYFNLFVIGFCENKDDMHNLL